MIRKTLLDTINTMLTEVLGSTNYRHNPSLELTSTGHDIHIIESEIPLNCGKSLTVRINFNKGAVHTGVGISQPYDLNSTDLNEMASVTNLIEQRFDTIKAVTLFEQYRGEN